MCSLDDSFVFFLSLFYVILVLLSLFLVFALEPISGDGVGGASRRAKTRGLWTVLSDKRISTKIFANTGKCSHPLLSASCSSETGKKTCGSVHGGLGRI